jgi:hypothetical protein
MDRRFIQRCLGFDLVYCFFANYTIHQRHSQRTHTHPYECTHANPTPRSIFEDCAVKSSRLTKSPQALRCRRERRLPLKAQTPLHPKKFTSTGSRTKTWGATRALVTTRLQVLSRYLGTVGLSGGVLFSSFSSCLQLGSLLQLNILNMPSLIAPKYILSPHFWYK